MNTDEKVLFIDADDNHTNDENILALHPSKVSFLSLITNGSFQRGVIRNVATGDLSSLGFFYIGNALKENAILDVYVHQPIGVMQSLEAEEIEALAKLAGYSNIKITQVKQIEKEIKFPTIKLTMVRPKKVLLSK